MENIGKFRLLELFLASFLTHVIIICLLINSGISSPIAGDHVTNKELGFKSLQNEEYLKSRQKRSMPDESLVGSYQDEFDIGPAVSGSGNIVVPNLKSFERTAAASAPKFMIDLFEKFEHDRSTRPTSNIIRSFSNLASMDDRNLFRSVLSECADEHVCARKHLLLFNVSAILSHEVVQTAELRLFKIVERDRRSYVGVDRKVEVSELSCTIAQGEKFCDPVSSDTESLLLDSKHIYGRHSGWETFNITAAVRRWVQTKQVHQLQITIETIKSKDESSVVDIDPDPASANEPLLIVFSDDTSRHHHQKRKHEMASLMKHQPTDINKRKKRSLNPDNVSKSRVKRHATQPGPCRLEQFYIDFSDINYDWIVSPKGYSMNRCVGTCNPPYNGQNPTPHVIIQGLLNTVDPGSHSKPCCVPTRLSPISMLYRDEGTIVYTYNYENMKVTECGCR